MKPNVVAGIDIGTTKIAVVVAQKNEKGQIEILAHGNHPSIGVSQGQVINVTRTTESIIQAVKQAEEQCGFTIDEAYVGIAGRHIEGTQRHDSYNLDKSEEIVTQEHLDTMIKKMENILTENQKSVIHVIPQQFVIDDKYDLCTTDPVGVAAKTIKGDFLIITADIDAIRKIIMSVNNAGIKIKGTPILEPIASCAAVLTPKDCEAGVALIDIGGGTTDIAIYKDNILQHTTVIPMGGNEITNDIKKGCRIVEEDAIELKEQFGSAIIEEKQQVIVIPGIVPGREKRIEVQQLSGIIKARMEQILEQVFYEINSFDEKSPLLSGVILTGGGANLKNIILLAESVTGMPTRIGTPNKHLAQLTSTKMQLCDPIYSTVIGLAILGIENEQVKPVITDEGSLADEFKKISPDVKNEENFDTAQSCEKSEDTSQPEPLEQSAQSENQKKSTSKKTPFTLLVSEKFNKLLKSINDTVSSISNVQ